MTQVVEPREVDYDGDMVRRYSATVRGGAVRVDEVGLEDGTVVDVAISVAGAPERWEDLPADLRAAIRQGEREIARGDSITGDELLRRLREGGPVYRPDQRQRAAPARPHPRAVGRRTSARRKQAGRPRR
jgi:hypothetical protein